MKAEPINLLPPGVKTWMSTYRILYSTLLGPLIIIGIGLQCFMRLDSAQLASIMIVACILLLNICFYALRKRKEESGIFIWIDLEEIQLLKKGMVLYRDSLKNLRVKKMGLPSTPKDLPNTLLIEGKTFPRLFIRSAPSLKFRQSTEKVDFCVATEKEWMHLLQALVTCEQSR